MLNHELKTLAKRRVRCQCKYVACIVIRLIMGFSEKPVLLTKAQRIVSEEEKKP